MDRFLEMEAFAAVVQAGSFIKAADALNISKAAISRYVAQLESRLGVRLLQRTTRTLSLTPEGEAFHRRCRELLDGVALAETEVAAHTQDASGLLRINVPVSFGLLHLAPLWPEFMRRHPKVTLEVTLTDRLVDLVDEGFDMAVRIAHLPSSSLVSRALASTRMVLCASPAYLRTRGAPRHPSELAAHDVLAYSLFSMGDQWEFAGPGGTVSVHVTPRLRTNSGDTCRAAALRDQGIVLQPTFLVGADLTAGTLVEVMPAWRSVTIGIHVIYPTRKFVSPKVRLMTAFLVEAFGQPAWPE